ncbi:MAG: glycoside hydrolase family 5 protein [Clostridiales bacterium]|nr:glycoside hydrolase family 5 protein [Clostridiales bacterium]
MKKKIHTLTALFLSCVMLFTSCVSDNSNTSNSTNSSTSTKDTMVFTTTDTQTTAFNTTTSTSSTTSTKAKTSASATTEKTYVNPAFTKAKTNSATKKSTKSSDNSSTPTDASNFAKTHGALSVNGTNLVDSKGNKIQLYGMSTHGIAWFPQYVSKDTFKTLRDDWNINAVRLAMYTAEYNGYSEGGGDKTYLKNLVKKGVDAATELGMYVIIDWHILSDQDPNKHKSDAIAFFNEMASLYKNHTNVIYEICNEPNGSATWDSVYSYTNEVIPVIRKHDKDAVIIVGTPTWSQDIDKALAKPLKYDNILYALHFYAATHTQYLRDRLKQCYDAGLPVIISEFGLGSADGNGSIDYTQSKLWLQMLDKYNISYFAWNIANKNETSSILLPSTNTVSNWSESQLSESGKYLRNWFRNK